MYCTYFNVTSIDDLKLSGIFLNFNSGTSMTI